MTEDQFETIEGKKQIVSQTIKTLRASDSLPISTLVKVSNFENDTQLYYLTGLTKEDGLQDYLMDSVYYDLSGNDTLIRMFVHLNNHWQLMQIFRKKFRLDNQIDYFMSERHLKVGRYYKKETFYEYNSIGRKLNETEFECSHGICDSIYKKEYIYNLTGNVDSTVSYIWKDNIWTEINNKSDSQ